MLQTIQISMLMLGAGGSGKSTLVQQLCTIYTDGPSEYKRSLRVKTIRERVFFETIQMISIQRESFKDAILSDLADEVDFY